MSQTAAQHEATIKHRLIVRTMIALISVIREFRITGSLRNLQECPLRPFSPTGENGHRTQTIPRIPSKWSPEGGGGIGQQSMVAALSVIRNLLITESDGYPQAARHPSQTAERVYYSRKTAHSDHFSHLGKMVAIGQKNTVQKANWHGRLG